jgi:hypothetical protein
MTQNPFDPKNAGLLGLLSALAPEASPSTSTLAGLPGGTHSPASSYAPHSAGIAGIFGSLAPNSPSAISSSNALARVIASSPPLFASPAPSALGSLSALTSPPSPLVQNALYAPSPKPAPAYVPTPVKRKGFFSFHYADIIRVNNVRNAWKIDCPDREDKRQFYDRSLWESVQRKSPEGLKSLIRRGMEHASVVCVLVGTHTWNRPWVRYEIARSVVEQKGLLAVHINGLRHHHRLAPDALGDNPLYYMGVGCPEQGIYYIYERVGWPAVQYGQMVWHWEWQRYREFTTPVSVPKYMQAPVVGKVVPLSAVTAIYDYVEQQGHKNIGSWIDTAALRAGR